MHLDDPIDRRKWIKSGALLGAAWLAGTRLGVARGPGVDALYRVGTVVEGHPLPLPDDKHIPFGWAHATLTKDRPVRIFWSGAPAWVDAGAVFRITGATDIRENVRVGVRLAAAGRSIGEFDMRYGALMQPFESDIPSGEVAAVLEEGVELAVLEGSTPIWIFSGAKTGGAPPAYSPHLIPGRAGVEGGEWTDRLFSLDSIQRFGWMAGAALDGLYASANLLKGPGAAKRLARMYLRMFTDADGRLRYQGIHNRLFDVTMLGGEDPLPFATLAKAWPDCPAMSDGIAYFERIADPDRPAGRWISTEGCYTMNYPMAVVARVFDRPHFAEACIDGLLARRRYLVDGGRIHRNANREEGVRGFGNWARGATWYVIGYERSLEYLPRDNARRAEVIETFREGIDLCFRHQRSDGLWTCFMDEPETGIDTSGSAGIAAAAALGVKNGFLDPSYRALAAKTYETLTRSWLAPDGYLRGGAQENKGGRELQVSGYRGIAPYALGLLGLLKAGLG